MLCLLVYLRRTVEKGNQEIIKNFIFRYNQFVLLAVRCSQFDFLSVVVSIVWVINFI